MWRLPPPHDLRQPFRETGVLLVPDALDGATASELADDAIGLSRRSGRQIRRASDAGVLDYGVITGEVIKSDAPRILALYESVDLLEWIRAVTGVPGVARSPYLRSAVNINLLGINGQQYRWHTDAVPFTVLLFLTTLPAEAGGELLVRADGDTVMRIPPIAGQLVLMDGQRRAHSVAPLLKDAARISVPMVFPAVQVDRPAGLDDYLYADT
jgi:hypothetical protein